ncbi:flavin reductase family protein [Rhizobium oryzicola]|uniref:Flavin reductase family protein n=1 Tax=Rhizobium oryzicola TaxID=1232668 RepID=A0ABT8SX90_9HYPH|nr:flavin reductase family protein [Rhizobium oryzicola]MDO1582663.1 flavin reductase family protein [Rhizobium oryzicola]
MTATAIEVNASTPAGVGQSFRTTMRRFPATVTVITSCGAGDGRDHGMTVTAVTSVSMDPPSLLVCLNNRSLLHELLLGRPDFVVNVLTQDQVAISDAFSGKVAPEERFAGCNWRRHENGVLYLPNAHAAIACRRVAAMPYGTHTVFIGQVISAEVQESTRPLLYENAQYCASSPAVLTA